MRHQGTQIETLVDSIIDSALLTIEDNINWVLRDGTLKSRVAVKHPEFMSFTLEIIKSSRLPRCSIQLLYERYPVRRFCSNHRHDNPHDCLAQPLESFSGFHKHKWSDLAGDECVYIPDDISLVSLEQMFYDFCTECGITFEGRWNDPPPTQLGFETVA